MHACDGQTDRQTDRILSLDRVCIACSAVNTHTHTHTHTVIILIIIIPIILTRRIIGLI